MFVVTATNERRQVIAQHIGAAQFAESLRHRHRVATSSHYVLVCARDVPAAGRTRMD
jgi:hypothetical protein